jgi:hypothetical protein
MKIICPICELFPVGVFENNGFIEIYCVRCTQQPGKLTEVKIGMSLRRI